MKSSYIPGKKRDFAEIIPAVTEPPKPNGLPIVIIQSPTFACSESPNFKNGNFSFDSIFNNAKSEEDANDKKKSDKEGDDKADTLLLGMKMENLSTSLRTKFKIEKDVSGVVITKLSRNSPGVEVGIKTGDVIMSFNKIKVTNVADLSKLVSEAQKSGAKNAVLLIRRVNTNQFVVINLE